MCVSLCVAGMLCRGFGSRVLCVSAFLCVAVHRGSWAVCVGSIRMRVCEHHVTVARVCGAGVLCVLYVCVGVWPASWGHQLSPSPALTLRPGPCPVATAGAAL